ncbi:MAG: flagellar hook length determination-like protein, partial [Phenylobacterium sp.]|nr:flagellar hook length determination-like protein [Phenylobacterium sp.]
VGAAPGLHATPLVGRTEGAKTEAAADPIAAATASADPAAPQAAQEASKDNSGPAFAPTDPNSQTPTVATPAAMHAAAVAVRGAPQTVANLAAQIVKKLESKTTRFDVQLDPAGLGKVDVRVEIGAEGRITAALACHTAQGAEALKARSGELQQALEQAGFDVSGGLSFEMAGGQGGQTGAGQGQNDTQNNSGQAFRGRAFQSGLDVAGDAAQAAADVAARLNRSRSAGVDIRI